MSGTSRSVGRPGNTLSITLPTTPSGQGVSLGTHGYTSAGGMYVSIVDSGTPSLTTWAQVMVSGSSGALAATEVAYGDAAGNIIGDAAFTFTTATGLLAVGRAALATAAGTGAQAPSLKITPGAHTALTAATEFPVVDMLAATQEWTAGAAIATQRFVRLGVQTIAFTGPSTVTEAVGLDVEGPQAGAGPATLTAAYAIKGSIGAAATNTVLPVAAFFRYSTGGAGASGIGASIALQAESAGSVQRNAALIAGVLDDATNGTEESTLRVTILGNGVAGEAFRVSGPAATIVNRINAAGSATGVAASLTAEGETNTPLTVSSSGLGVITLTPGRDGLVVTPRVSTTGTPVGILYNGVANTGVTAATESNDFYLSLGRTVTWAAGAGPLAQNRAIRIDSPIYAGNAGGPLTITEATTLWIQDAPSAGANMTLTTAYAFLVAAGRVRFNGPVVQNVYPVLNNTGTVGAPVTTINTPRGITVIANGATSVAVTCAACTSETIVHATIMNATTNNVSIRAVVPGAGSFTVHVTGDPGASTAIIGVSIIQPGTGV